MAQPSRVRRRGRRPRRPSSAAGQRSKRVRITGPTSSGEMPAKASAADSRACVAPRLVSAAAISATIARAAHAASSTRSGSRTSPVDGSPSAGTAKNGSEAGGYSSRMSRYGTSPSTSCSPVALVERRVLDRVVGEEADVEEGPRRREEPDRERGHDGRKRDVSGPGPAFEARVHGAQHPRRARPAAPGTRAGRSRRTGRTTGCRGRTSASGRARSRAGSRRSARRAGAAPCAAGRSRRRSSRSTSSPSSTHCTSVQVGDARPRGTGAQSHSENGDSRPICHPSVRSQKTRAAWSGFGSSSRIENAASVAARKPARKESFARGRFVPSG